MKRAAKFLLGAAFAAAAAVSFFAGSRMKEQEQSGGRAQRCRILVSFAEDKAENGNLSDPDIMETLVSYIYAAYEYCDDPELGAELYALWNSLIFYGDRYIGREAALADQLGDILEELPSENAW